jgi:hypothetical protein
MKLSSFLTKYSYTIAGYDDFRVKRKVMCKRQSSIHQFSVGIVAIMTDIKHDINRRLSCDFYKKSIK